MICEFWVTLKDGADRPYVSSTPPSPERLKALNEAGALVYRVETELPGFKVENGRIRALASAPLSETT